MMGLGGLALILGRVIDDSIVDVENTVRHLNMGKAPLDAARDSANEISIPVLMSTVTTVVVFLPLTFMTGVGKYLFTPLALSATLAMAASYLVSRTVSPVYCANYLRADHERERFPRWLLWAAVPAALVGLGLPAVAHYGSGVLDRVFGEEAGDAVAAPYYAFSAPWRRAIVAVGIAGGIVLVVAALFAIGPWFHRGFTRLTNGYERSLRLFLRWRLAVLVLVAAGVLAGV